MKRFDINRDFSWLFFGCLVVVLIVVVIAFVIGRLLA
jgi:hypothetical protein